jgi:hypothetical protein
MFLRRQLCAVVNRVLVSEDRHNDRVSIARAVIGWVRPRKPLRTSAGASLGVIYGCSVHILDRMIHMYFITSGWDVL